MTATIRPLEPTDSLHDLTALLHRAYARLAGMGLNYTAADQTAEKTADRVRGGTCFVALRGDDLVGTILVQPTYDTNDCAYFTRPGVACVHQFAVDPSLQGEGLGRRLLDHAEDWARTRGYAELAMDTAVPATHLVALYGRWGYRTVDEMQWPGKVYRSVVLSKPLAAGDAAA